MVPPCLCSGTRIQEVETGVASVTPRHMSPAAVVEHRDGGDHRTGEPRLRSPQAPCGESQCGGCLGIALGELKQTIVIPEDIPVLEIKAGTYELQRFFYYHFMKLFYNPELPFTRHVVNNWNAYFPGHVLFHSVNEIRGMVTAAGLEFELFNDQGNGIALIARKV